MRKLTFDFGDPQIEINGIVFELEKSDIEICEIARNAQRRFESIDKNDCDNVLEACRETAKDIDSILGAGALAKLSCGKPVGVMKQIEILVAIASEGTKEYQDYVKAEYLPDDNG